MNLDAVKAGKGLTERSACVRLAKIAKRVPRDQAIVELGAFQGRTTAWLAWGSANGHGAPVFSVDPWDLLDVEDQPDYAPEWEHHYRDGGYASGVTFDAYQQHLTATGAKVTPIRAYAEQAGYEWDGPKVGLLWHDAQHTAEAVRADLQAWTPHLASGSTVALHDACQAAYGVIKGAAVLDTPDFDWAGRRVHKWKKHPDRRGMLVVKRC